MEHTTSLREKALDWWRYLPTQRCADFMNNLGLEWGVITDEMVETIYLKEHPQIEWWYRIAEEKKDEIKKRHNFYSNQQPVSDSDILFLYNYEHPTEVEVNNIEETVEQAAIQYSTVYFKDRGSIQYSEKKEGFLKGAEWQKEKDRVLIVELLDSLKKMYADLNNETILFNSSLTYVQIWEISESISKAEKHLNNP